MDAKLKADWVKALRSGEYAQSRFRLKQVDGFCCLGVLCEVAGLPIEAAGLRVAGAPDDDGYRPIRLLIDRGHDILDVMAELNDEDRMSFPEIADWIEANL